MKQQGFSRRMKYILYHTDKIFTKIFQHARIFSPLRIKDKTIEKQYPFGS